MLPSRFLRGPMNKLFSIASIAGVALLSPGFAAKATAQTTPDTPLPQDAIAALEDPLQLPTDTTIPWLDRQNDSNGDRAALPARLLPGTEASQWVEADGWQVLDDGTIVLSSGGARSPQFEFPVSCESHFARK